MHVLLKELGQQQWLFVCLFVCLFEFDVTIAGEGLLGTYGHFAVKVLIHLLRHGASVYYGHLRGPMTLTPVADRERLAVELSLHVLMT